MQRTSGFTLVELLIGLGIMGVLTVAFLQFFTASVTITQRFDTRNELLSDGQTAQQLVSSRVQEAWYIYPTSTPAFSLSGIPNVQGWAVGHPSGAGTWKIGTDAILAFLVPPSSVGGLCTPTAATPVTAGCYEFYAYYPVKRAAYVTGTTSTYSNRLLSDGENGGAWVLMQLVGYVAPTAIASGSAQPPTLTTSWLNGNLQGARVDLVSDYLSSNTSTGLPFRIDATSTNPDRVEIELRLARTYKGKSYEVGGTDQPLRNVATARNHGITAP